MEYKLAAIILAAFCASHVAGDLLANGCPMPAEVSDSDEYADSVDVLFAHDSDCTNFYACTDGVRRIERCPEGLEFNPVTLECVSPEDSGCTCTTTTEATTVTTTTHAPCTCPGFSTDDEILPDPYDCSVYLTCVNGNIVINHCPEGQHWSVADQKCDWACHVGCVELPPGCVGFPTGDEILPNPADCHTWLTCCDNTIVVNPCPPGQNYDFELQRCDWECHAQCYGSSTGTPPTGTPPTGTPPVLPHSCPFPDPLDYTVHLPHATNCTLFYKCDHGAPVLMTCPDHLHFNPLLQVCDWPYEAGCRAEGRAKETTFPPAWYGKKEERTRREVVEENVRRCALGGEFRFAHRKDCSLYYECEERQAVLKCCGSGLYFSSATELCVARDEAGCEV